MGQESISATSRLTILNVDGGSDANLVFHRIFGRREVLTPGQIPWGDDASLTQRFSGSPNGTTSTNSMISFLGAAAYVVVPGDVQWVRLGPYERSGGPCPGPPILCFWYFFDSDSRNFCSRKMESKAVVL